MLNVLKQFGLGVLWALLSPIILLAVIAVGLFGIANFLIQFVIMIVNFFRGKKLFPPFPEDEKAYKILKKTMDEEKDKEEQEKNETTTKQPQSVYVQQNYYTTGAIPGVPPMGMPGYDPNNPYAGLPPQGTPYNMPPGYTGNPVPPPTAIPGVPPLQQIPPYVPPTDDKIDIFTEEEEEKK